MKTQSVCVKSSEKQKAVLAIADCTQKHRNPKKKGRAIMQRVGEFEKVSYKQFYEAMSEIITAEYKDSFIKAAYDTLALPSRATGGSAGYDFKAPFSFTLEPGATIKIPTGVRVKVDEGWWLGCLPRSGLGFKYRMQLNNTMGVIDSDYYYSSNEGHIFAKVTNDSVENKTLEVKAGDGFLQAIFIPYGVTYSDGATGVRNGGMGSTGR